MIRLVRSVVLAPFRLVAWAGRVALWLVFWPLGLWRSLRHSQRKAAAR